MSSRSPPKGAANKDADALSRIHHSNEQTEVMSSHYMASNSHNQVTHLRQRSCKSDVQPPLKLQDGILFREEPLKIVVPIALKILLDHPTAAYFLKEKIIQKARNLLVASYGPRNFRVPMWLLCMPKT
jgi:hypothetical protein